jgi:mRNA interferase RelE/StbE
LAWTIEFVPAARKELKKLGRAEAARIVGTLETRIAARDDPRQLGTAPGGELGGLWRWRIGGPSAGSGEAYRLIARIEDERITILGVRVAHGRVVYR